MGPPIKSQVNPGRDPASTRPEDQGSPPGANATEAEKQSEDSAQL